MNNRRLSDDALELVAGRFRLLADSTRLKILHALEMGEMNVTELVEATQAGQANVSKHLASLLSGGIVTRRKEGLNAIYRVTDESIFDLCDTVCSGLKTQFETRQTALAKIFN